jgi:hypothetical protein
MFIFAANKRDNIMKQKTLDFLEAHQSETPSKWREEKRYFEAKRYGKY